MALAAQSDANSITQRSGGKSAEAFRTISEVANELEIPQHVLRFWESKFSQVKPLKRGGGRRYYRPEDIVLLRNIRTLLYQEGYTIKGVQKLLREGQGKRSKDHGTVAEDQGDQLSDSQRREIRAIIDELTELRNMLSG